MEEYVSRASIAHFGAKFFKAADSRRSQSTVCSPLSAEIVMAMLALGCSDESKQELMETMGFRDDDALRSSFAHITSRLKSINGATLNVCNRIYVTMGTELKPDVKKDAEEVFESTIESLDSDWKESATNSINNWLAELIFRKTFSRAVSGSTRFMLANAIYFQGVWEKPFYTRLNADWQFYLSKDEQTSVPVMKTTEKWFKYGVSARLNARLLQMRFEGGEASMVIVLPNEIEGLRLVLHKLASRHNIMADIESLKETEVDVMLPKFEGRSVMMTPLKSSLMKLGITSIFDGRKSEVNLLTKNKALFGSNAFQDTFLDKDQREMAKTVECTMSSTEDVNTTRFIADRPFFYMVIIRGIPILMASYRGNSNPRDVLNYSCNNIKHIFSMSVSTFYSRYDNRIEQQSLGIILANHAWQVMREADDDNSVNRIRERRLIREQRRSVAVIRPINNPFNDPALWRGFEN